MTKQEFFELCRTHDFYYLRADVMDRAEAAKADRIRRAVSDNPELRIIHARFVDFKLNRRGAEPKLEDFI